MKQKQINYPEIKNNDIKVLGRVVSIASANKVAAAEQVFDEKFNYDLIGDYSWDNIIDATRSEAGMDQYTINRLFGKKLKKFDDAFQFDEDGWILELKVRNLIADDATINNKLTTKDLKVTNNADINNLHVSGNSVFDGDVNIAGNLVVKNRNITDSIEQLFSIVSGEDKNSSIWQAIVALENWKTLAASDISWLKDKVNYLLQCCEDMQNRPQGGITLNVSPESIDFTVGDPDIALSASTTPQLVGSATFTSNDTSVCTIVNNKAHAVAEGTTTITVAWGDYTRSIPVTVHAPAPTLYTITYMDDTSIITTEDYEAGATIDPLHGQDPLTKEGYTFAGWDGMPSDMKMPANDITVTAKWTQNEQPVEPISPESISISGPNAVQVGNTITLTATITPSNADTDTAITWSSSDESKATVNNGVVTGVAEGDVVITATTANGRTATHNITVNPAPTQNPQSITITGAKDLKVGTAATASDKTCTLVATISPAEADQSVTWSSSDNTKATVDNGVVSAISEGSVTITATSTADPLVSGSVTINITLENAPEPIQDEKYKVSWTKVPNTNSISVTGATTDNGQYFNINEAAWDAWEAIIRVDSPYIFDSFTVTMNGQDITSSVWNSPTLSIPKSSITGDIEFTIVAHENTETGNWNVDYSNVLNNNAHINVHTVIPSTCNSTPGTVGKGEVLLMYVIADNNYQFSGDNPVTVTMGGVDVSNNINTVTGNTYVYFTEGEDSDYSQVWGYVVKIPSVTGDVVITASTSQIAVPTVKHTISWTYSGAGEHATLANASPVVTNGGLIDDGSHFTAKIQGDEGYRAYLQNMQMKDSNDQWQTLYLYGTEGGYDYWNPVEFTININNVSGDVQFEIRTEQIPVTPNSDTLFRDEDYADINITPDAVDYTVSAGSRDSESDMSQQPHSSIWKDVTEKTYGGPGHGQGNVITIDVPMFSQDGINMGDVSVTPLYSMLDGNSYISSDTPPDWFSVNVEKIYNEEFFASNGAGFHSDGVRVTITVDGEADYVGTETNIQNCWIELTNDKDDSTYSIKLNRIDQYYTNTVMYGTTFDAVGSSIDAYTTSSKRDASNPVYAYAIDDNYTCDTELVSSEPWISITDNGVDEYGRHNFTLTAEANNTGSSRTATVQTISNITAHGVTYRYVAVLSDTIMTLNA